MKVYINNICHRTLTPSILPPFEYFFSLQPQTPSLSSSSYFFLYVFVRASVLCINRVISGFRDLDRCTLLAHVFETFFSRKEMSYNLCLPSDKTGAHNRVTMTLPPPQKSGRQSERHPSNEVRSAKEANMK